jgi:hypothetical protein
MKKESEITGEKLLNFENMCKLLNMLGFLPAQRVPESVESQLCQDLWTLLHGDSTKGVSIENLRVVLLNVIGVRVADREVVQEHNDT